jgi:hypothetical protein
MPDQPDDPIHYDMKIPPEPQDAPLNKQREEQRGSEATGESSEKNEQARDPTGSATPSSSSDQ